MYNVDKRYLILFKFCFQSKRHAWEWKGTRESNWRPKNEDWGTKAHLLGEYTSILGESSWIFQKIATTPDLRRITTSLLGELGLLLAEYTLFWDIYKNQAFIRWDYFSGNFWRSFCDWEPWKTLRNSNLQPFEELKQLG